MNEVRAREYLETDKAFCRSVILLTGCLLHTLSSAMSRRGQKMLMWPGHCSQPIRGQSPVTWSLWTNQRTVSMSCSCGLVTALRVVQDPVSIHVNFRNTEHIDRTLGWSTLKAHYGLLLRTSKHLTTLRDALDPPCNLTKWDMNKLEKEVFSYIFTSDIKLKSTEIWKFFNWELKKMLYPLLP